VTKQSRVAEGGNAAKQSRGIRGRIAAGEDGSQQERKEDELWRLVPISAASHVCLLVESWAVVC